jgi:orotate phosphoribosyltransferase
MPTDALEAFRRTGALLEGHFILRSGLHSRQFFQCALLQQHAKLASDLAADLANQVRHLKFDAVISPAMGGILVGQDLARHLETRHLFTEKEEGRLKLRRFTIKPGERFLVAEDVVTTGSAVKEVLEIVKAAGAFVEGVAVIVDRSGDKTPDFGVPFFSLLKLRVETFEPDQLPKDLAEIPAVKPGSK